MAIRQKSGNASGKFIEFNFLYLELFQWEQRFLYQAQEDPHGPLPEG
jgi:hypothetical protein